MKKEEILQQIDYPELASNCADPRITKNCSNTIMYKTEMCNFAMRAIDDDYLCCYDEFFEKLNQCSDEIRTLTDLDKYIITFSKYIKRKHLTECTVDEVNIEFKKTVVHISNANILFNEIKIIEEIDKI